MFYHVKSNPNTLNEVIERTYEFEGFWVCEMHLKTKQAKIYIPISTMILS
jgi:acetolactate synthase regulatory subunit